MRRGQCLTDEIETANGIEVVPALIAAGAHHL